MNNDNNLNGTVLGSVNSTPVNNGIDTLNPGVQPAEAAPATPVEPVAPVMDNNVSQPVQPAPVSPMPEAAPVTPTAAPVEPMPNPQPNPQVVPEQPQVNPGPAPEPPKVEPAYTNPGAINPAPTPAFDNSNAIGTVPPISLDKANKPKKKGNKVAFILLILILLGGIGYGTYYVLNYTDLFNKSNKVTISTKSVQVDLNGTISNVVSDYANITGTDSKNCSVQTDKIDVTTVGSYEFTVSCDDIVQTGTAVVVDNTPFVVNTKTIYKVKGDTLEASEFVVDTIEGVTYEFTDSESVNKLLENSEGTYDVTIKATKGEKSIEVPAKLIMLANKLKGFLSCRSNSQSVSGVSASMVVIDKFAISNTSTNDFAKLAEETTELHYTDETEYASKKTEHAGSGSKEITINDITGIPSFDDTNLTITIVKELDISSINSSWGEENLENYRTIKDYFTNSLGYTCTYESSND